jgi:C1A family cysteine protease
VFDDESCGTNLDHGVSVVGYDNDESSGKDYWNVRNSWGNTWGLKGYIWIARSEEEGPGICGICMAASWPQ